MEPAPGTKQQTPQRSEWWNLELQRTSWPWIAAVGCAAAAAIVAVQAFRPAEDPRAIERRWRELQDAVTAGIDAGRPADAVSAAKAALSLAERNFKEPNPAIGESCRRLVDASIAAGDYAAAEVAARRAAENYEALLGQGNLETAAVVGEYGMSLGRLGRFVEARPLLEGVVRACEKIAGPEAAATAAAIQNLADFNMFESRYDDAAPLYERALDITTKTAGPAGLTTAAAMAGLGSCLARAGDTPPKADPAARKTGDRAKELLERSLLIQQWAAGPADARAVPTLLHLAALRQAQNQPEQAEAAALEALAMSEARCGSRHPTTAAALTAYAGCAKTRGDLPLAQRCLDRAAVIRNNALGIGHPDTIATLDQLIDVLIARGDYTSAEKPCRALLQGLTNKRPEDAEATKRATERLAEILDHTERAEEAKTLRQRLAPPTEPPATAPASAPAPGKAAQ
jgi:tetratricopeptide (TPR) repeat protein